MSLTNEIVDGYVNFLRGNLQVNELEGGWVAVETPFLNCFNDCIEVYVKKSGRNVLLTDGGETLQNLELLGVTFKRKSRRKNIFDNILRNYGVKLQGEELSVVAEFENLAQAKHRLLSAIIEVSDLYVLTPTKSAAEKIFVDNVNEYFKENRIISTPQFTSKGITGLEMVFDFQIAGYETEMLIDVFNNLQQNNASLFLFGWDDIKTAREQETGKKITGMAIINDETSEVKPELLDALRNKNAEYIFWSERQNERIISKFKNVA